MTRTIFRTVREYAELQEDLSRQWGEGGDSALVPTETEADLVAAAAYVTGLIANARLFSFRTDHPRTTCSLCEPQDETWWDARRSEWEREMIKHDVEWDPEIRL